MRRIWIIHALIAISIMAFASTSNAMAVLGLGLTDNGASYVSVSDTRATNIEAIFSSKNTASKTFDRHQGAMYLGWLNEWQGVRLSVGGLVLTEIDTRNTPPRHTVGRRQNFTVRAALTAVLNPLRVSVGVSGAGVDYLAGFELPVSDAVNLFAGYVSWPTYHSGVAAGLSSRW